MVVLGMRLATTVGVIVPFVVASMVAVVMASVVGA